MGIMYKFIIFFILNVFIACSLTSQVSQQWAAVYDGPNTNTDRINDIAIDAAGNVYVTGESRGNGTNTDYATIKYNSSGAVEWIARYNFSNRIDIAYSIAIDASGNVYVTGYSYSDAINADFATVKYNASGVQQWAARYNGPFNSTDIANAVDVDASGNVFVTGYSTGSNGSQDYFTIKYNSSGTELWSARYDAGAWTDQALSLVIDGSGNAYVTGFSHLLPTTQADYATIKYNSSGIQQWVARYNGPANLYDQAKQLVLDDIGNVYVTGYSADIDTLYDYATIKYNSAGVQQWVSRYNGPDNKVDMATSIAVSNTGNVYVSGGSATVNNPIYNFDYATVKYNSAGAEQWVSRYNGPASGNDLVLSMKIDSYENVFVTGYSEGVGTNTDIAAVKYNSSGAQMWVTRYNGTANNLDQGSSIEVDNFGNIFVGGTCRNNDYDFITLKYHEEPLPVEILYFNCEVNDNSAVLSWGTSWELNNSGFYIERKNLNDNNWVSLGFVHGAGTTNDEKNYFYYDNALLKGNYMYRLKQVDFNGNHEYHNLTNEVKILSPGKFVLEQNYPNPSNPNSIIDYNIPLDSWVKIAVYDLLGKEVKVLVNEFKSSDYYSVSFDGRNLSSGVYFYTIQAGEFTEVKKMILVK